MMTILPRRRQPARSGIERAEKRPTVTPLDPCPPTAEWRTLPINDNYEVSEFGHLRRAVGGSNTKKGKAIRPTLCRIGKRTKTKIYVRRTPYVKYTISRDCVEKSVLAHRLVALAFLGPPPSDDYEVAHHDGNGSNCHRDNLRWATSKENAEDKRRHGTLVIGERVNTNKLTTAQVLEIRAAEGSHREISKRYGVHEANISDIKRGKSWRHLL